MQLFVFLRVILNMRGGLLGIHHLNLIINLTMIKSQLVNCLALAATFTIIALRPHLDQTLFGLMVGALTMYLFQQI